MINLSWRPKLNPDGTIAYDQGDADEIAKHYGPGDHPSGSSQDAHAGSRLIPIDPSAPQFPDLDNTLNGMPKALREKVEAQALKMGTNRQILARLRRLLKSAMLRDPAVSGLHWYQETHTWLEGLATTYGYTPEEAAGATAAMSSGLRWEAAPGKASNKAAVEALMRHLGEDRALSSYSTLDIHAMQAILEADAFGQRTKDRGAILDYVATTLTPQTRLSDLTNPREAALVFSGIWRTEGYSLPAQYGYDPYMDAIEILRGAPPGNFLAGPKRRSFFNNLMLIPNDDVTIDVQMISAARGRAINSQIAEDKVFQTSVVGTPKLGNIGVGVHPLLADHVRRLTDEVNASDTDPWGNNVLPMQVQAIIWTEFKTRNAAQGES